MTAPSSDEGKVLDQQGQVLDQQGQVLDHQSQVLEPVCLGSSREELKPLVKSFDKN